MNKALKFVSFLYLLVCFILESLAARLSKGNSSESPKEALRKCANRISDYSNRALRILGVRTFLLDVPSEIRSGLIVANHISYLDVLVLSRVAPLLFVTSTEVRDTPGLGLITRLAGCLFVERRNRSKIKSDSSDIQAALDSNIPVVLFPEGTSSDGSGVLPFRAALFQSAIDAKTPVHLFQIHYEDEAAAYHGDHQFLSHLWRVCSRGRIRANLRYLGRLKTENQDRKSLAIQAEIRIRSAHVSGIRGGSPSQSNLDEIRLYPRARESQPGLL